MDDRGCAPSASSPAPAGAFTSWQRRLDLSPFVDRQGHPFYVTKVVPLTCPAHLSQDGQIVPPDPQCLAEHGWFSQATYQPADRFWLFEGIESAQYLALTGGLLIFTRWSVRKRIG